LSIYNEYGKRIEKQIRPKSFPLAIKMIKEIDEIPPEALRPKKDFNSCLSTCQCFALSRKFGTTIAQLFEDMWCPEPAMGFGFAEPPQYFFEGHTRYPDGVETLEAGATYARNLPRFEVGKYMGVVSAPLTTASFEPDIAVIYCDSAQLLKLLLGIAYKDGRDIPSVLGGHAACVYSVVPPMLNNDCHVAVPCRGDRARAGAQDDELIFSVPKDKIADLALGLEQKGTSSIPMRYSMKAEYMLSPSYAKHARLIGMKKADGSEIEGFDEEQRKFALEYR
jgi:uncharacterized protein (DUF169 family)